MSEATISFTDHDLLRTLFGAGDQYLRQVRDSVGIDVVIRGDELRLHGEADNIQRGLRVFQELQQIIERTGRLDPWEVEHVLSGSNGDGVVPPAGDAAEDDAHASIDLFEKAKRVVPRTKGQAEYVRTIAENDLVFSTGPAGCGKTFLAVAMAVNALRSEQVRKIVLVRPAVEAGEKLGFLPGDMIAKVNPYLRPLLDSLNDILDFEQVKRYMARDVIEIVPLAFMRGRTLNSTFIILDEAQNTTLTQMKMFLTRMGQESKIVVTGDTTQIDLPVHVTSGLVDAVARLGGIDGVGVVKLTGRDIVRHRLVREVVRAYDDQAGERKSRRK
ncbi:MAG TPA: PhoH family protein [Planctomycetaceae bacterium]|nr:PhoH family protein [Planctomycetaceae bacterium]